MYMYKYMWDSKNVVHFSSMSARGIHAKNDSYCRVQAVCKAVT